MSRLKKPKVFLFDLYSTLIDVKTDDYDEDVWEGVASHVSRTAGPVEGWSLRQAYESRLRLQQSTSSEQYPEVQVTDAMRDGLADLGYVLTRPQSEDVMRVFRSLSMRRFSLFQDTLPALDSLRSGYRLGLVSDAQRVFFDDEVNVAGLSEYFEVVVCSSDFPFHKPDRRMFGVALELLGVAPEDAIYVGDSLDRDMAGCRNSGVSGILLDRGGNFSGPPDEFGPNVVIGSLLDLKYLF